MSNYDPTITDPNETQVRARILLRWRDLNARGKGHVCYRLILRGEELVWATEVAERIKGDWTNDVFRAAGRHAKQTGEMALGTVVVTITKPSHGSSASYKAGRVRLDENGKGQVGYAGDGVEHVSVSRQGSGFVHTLIVDGKRIVARSA